MEDKICSKCKETKPMTEFRRDKSKKDGFHPHCKTCQLINRRKDPNNLVRIEGEKRRHREYGLRQRGLLDAELNPLDKATIHLKRYYQQHPEKLQEKRDLIYKREEYFINSKKKINANSRGELFRSQLEVNFSELLIAHNIPYEYEVVFKLINGKRKVVDFLIKDFLIVEISGYAYEDWKIDFNTKIKLLRQSTELPILILTYPKSVDEIMKRNLVGCDIFFDSVDNFEHILRGIKFYENTKNVNEFLKQSENV